MSLQDVYRYCPECGTKIETNSTSESSSRVTFWFECECGKKYEFIVDDMGTRIVYR